MSLITAWLNHKSLVNIARTLISHGCRINRLPGVFGSGLRWDHTVHETILVVSVVSVLVMGSASLLTSLVLPCLGFLIDESHRKLPDINRMIGVVLVLVDDVQIRVLHGLLLLLFVDV